jgi:hypothetical protein
MKSSRHSSASRHKKSSFSFSRLGVSSRLRSDRALVWSGGSIVTMCSNSGSWLRFAAMRSLMSSPSGVNGSGGNGPPTAMHDENVSVSLSTVFASSYPVIARMP